jgi:hypothetical protein
MDESKVSKIRRKNGHQDKSGRDEWKESRIKIWNKTAFEYYQFQQDGVVATVEEVGTILEVTLALTYQIQNYFKLIWWSGSIQIRRSGRNNAEG